MNKETGKPYNHLKTALLFIDVKSPRSSISDIVSFIPSPALSHLIITTVRVKNCVGTYGFLMLCKSSYLILWLKSSSEATLSYFATPCSVSQQKRTGGCLRE